MGVFLALEAPMLTAPGLHGAIPVRRATSAPKAWDDSSAAVWIGTCHACGDGVPLGNSGLHGCACPATAPHPLLLPCLWAPETRP